MLFSIITPINKIPKTFKNCTNSLQKQSYKKFEWLIVLNDEKEDLPKLIIFHLPYLSHRKTDRLRPEIMV